MKDRLNKLLKELHSELGDAAAMDAQAKDQLRDIAREIEAAVGPDEDKTLGSEAMGHLQEAAVDFESEYPRLAAVLSNIVDTLGKLGI